MSDIVTFSGNVTSATGSSGIGDAKVAHLLNVVGHRVRSARARKGISRRVLSEISGVSQRYLAQLESGSGNISIALLLRIASALDLRIEWLVAEDEPWDAELVAILTLFRNATRKQRDSVLEILDPEHPNLRRADRFALIGLRGAGKSTLGRLAAVEKNAIFIELNDEIEQASGMPVREVFALYGQEGYRHLERQSLERIAAAHSSVILAVAGGIVSEPDTFNYLLRNYHTIWIKAEPEEHMARVLGQGDERPMAGSPDAMEELRDILTSREALYSQAEFQVDTSNTSLNASLASVLEAIETGQILTG